MGNLSMEGRALRWEETAPLADHIRQQGIAQFARLYKVGCQRDGDSLKWGDELEFIVLRADDMTLSTQASAIIDKLNNTIGHVAKWNHEFASYMVEGVPLAPFEDTLECLNGAVEASMRGRRKALSTYFGPSHHILTLANYPMLGAGQLKANSMSNQVTKSEYVSDDLINTTHPRFANLARNIRERRGSLVDIKVPVWSDTYTAVLGNQTPNNDIIHMDAMTFGMGCCCLQVTFQTQSIEKARNLFDQFVVLAPIALALAAGAPIYRGTLSDIDTRWSVVSASVDDRTETERDPLDDDYICKSRYASISRYLNHPDLNDLPLRYNQTVLAQLSSDYPMIDTQLKLHLAHLFIRDPLVVYDGLINVPEGSYEHFENIQSTNWQTVRFKPPTSPVDGWRVEFRPMDIQVNDFENAAFAVWVCLYARIVSEYSLDFTVPISKVDENMKRAEQRDAVLEEKFWFNLDGAINEYPISEIVRNMNQYMKRYLKEKYGGQDYKRVIEYLALVEKRSTGDEKTNARFIRDFCVEHPEYKQDSKISKNICDDLIGEILRLDRPLQNVD